MGKFIRKILCYVGFHKSRQTTFNCWCLHCGKGMMWTGSRWVESTYPHCKVCGCTTNIKDCLGETWNLCVCEKNNEKDEK